MGKRDFYKEEKLRKTIYIFGITLVLSVVIFLTLFVMYNKKMKQEANYNFEKLAALEDIVENDVLEETSSTSDVTMKNAISQKNTTSVNTISKKAPKNEPVSSVIKNTTNKVSNTNKNTVKTENNISTNTVDEAKDKQLKFQAPVSGEIIKDFATDSLTYSKTLEEWTTHSGIDIKAEKTSIVVAAESGKIESIKNDPRYGLTITIVHDNGFKSIYSNLLSTEFVTEGEEVEKGQTIGTVGESASFEVADESHLHFELYKDGKVVNPTIYLK